MTTPTAGSAPVTIAVVTWNSADVLPGLIDSLAAGAGEVPYHLVVVDNASSDGTTDVARALVPDVTVVQTGRNAGYAAGVNAAIAADTAAPAVLVLNPDVRLAPGCLPTLMDALTRPGIGIAVPRLVDGDGKLIFSMRRRPTVLKAFSDAIIGATRAGRWAALGEVVTDPGLYESDRRTDWAEGSTQLVSRACLDACGPWDETYFLYSEETDFHLRAGAAGLGVAYVADATATHLEGDSATSPRLWALLTANRLRHHSHSSSHVGTSLYWLALVLREATRAGRGDATARAAVRVLFRPSLLRSQRGPQWLDQVRVPGRAQPAGGRTRAQALARLFARRRSSQ
ncbi:Glycosyltransferase, GT2 family [Nocardioides exalbidus]|uniref:Glycosyltransferase, GT2 family n=1 Tax=Nocardioides exalbidus TaxID=402596 RepID=A0A1H4KD39_9ACTN|nr:glycosyltransferase family 2 protein [Nocardioides exalbidus]SEB56411.1 Glycosyltransferase, GT2 family [Nocardioides exalbidus]